MSFKKIKTELMEKQKWMIGQDKAVFIGVNEKTNNRWYDMLFPDLVYYLYA